MLHKYHTVDEGSRVWYGRYWYHTRRPLKCWTCATDMNEVVDHEIF